MKLNEDLSVSVVVPFYNRSRFLKRLLDSVAKQTLVPDRVYIVDNGSSLKETLNAWHIIRTHSLVDKCIFTSSIDRGNANYARNLGYELATTRYVAFLDSDDWWQKNHLFQSIDCIQKSDKVAVYSGAIVHRMSGISLEKSVDVNELNNPFLLILSPEKHLAQTSSYIVDKFKLREEVKWDENLKRHQDFDYFASIYYQTHGWCYSNEPNVNIDWGHTSDVNKKIDFNSFIMFYQKWEHKIPNKIKKPYLLEMLYKSYRHKTNKKIKFFYRKELVNKGFCNNWKDKFIANQFFILFYIYSVSFLEKTNLKNTIKKLVPINLLKL